ncbi:CDPK-related kinase 6-like [Chenopodium quinoa]|uniref:CDPK-related kinase 6-like n=1 Tax=Chenopodium quinoa TaxID=63459 RepID=UPI000B799541|nr:CDPK-related kinase 6-like [Chenopodium quinoa]
MGHCYSKKTTSVAVNDAVSSAVEDPTPASVQTTPFHSPFPAGINPSPARTPGRRMMKWPFPPPSPAKPIMAAFRRRRKESGGVTPERTAEQEGEGRMREREVERERERGLDKNFGYSKNFGAKYELGKEVGRGHFGHTCWAKGKKGDVKGVSVAVKIISKAKMTSAVAIEDVRREVKMLKALSGNAHMLKFYDAFEDANNVYLVMELCEGGELLDRILQRGGRYVEEDAKGIVVQILSAVAFCHLQGVVHRDLKPENFLFATKEDDARLKVIDFGLSDYVRPDHRLNDVVGSAYYVAPEVLHRSYNSEADMWSIGVITYILLCGSRPYYARTESGIFRSVLRTDPNFDDIPWPNISAEGIFFVKRLLNKDHRKRMTAAQALAHPWLRDENRPLPLDIFPIKQVRSYMRATPLKRAALKALSTALTDNELFYLKAQFRLLEPKDGCVSLENFKAALARNATDAMKDARVSDFLTIMEPFSSKKIDFEEFCAAAISVYQLEALEDWDKIATMAFQYFEQEGNRRISVEDFARELNLGPTAHTLVKDWIRSSDGNINFIGYTKFLHGVTIRGSNTRRQ